MLARDFLPAIIASALALTITRDGLGVRWDDSTVCQPYSCASTLPPGVCSTRNATAVVVQACPPLQQCESLSGHCVAPKEVKGLPGDECAGHDNCLGTECVDHTCAGKGFLNNCNRTEECDRGLFCTKQVCWKQLEDTSRGCKSDFDCENGSGCNLAHDRSPACAKYFSLEKYTWVSDCVNYFSRLCKSATCLAPGGSGNGVCIDPIQSDPLSTSTPCTRHSDCDSVSGEFTFYGLCQCGGNPTAQKYCAPFPGDPAGKALVALMKEWYNSTEVYSCHTLSRETEACIRKWQRGGELVTAYIAYQHAVTLQGAEECVVQALFPDFTPNPVVNAAETLGLLCALLSLA